jgi:lysophospholipase L1-like esterase
MINHRLSLAALVLLTVAAPSQARDICAADPAVWGAFPALPRATRALAAERRLIVVAVGSSSTEGIGASSPDRAYPAQLEALLRERFPDATVAVVNRGVGGETVAANLARLQTDAIDLGPDVVIWQVGTNDALLGVPAAELAAALQAGIGQLRAAGADVVLLGPQPVARPDWESALVPVRGLLRDVATASATPLLSRHRLMSHWLASGRFPPDALLGPDGLHMTDASYRCLAERIADLFPAPDAPRRSAALPLGEEGQALK